MPYGLLTARFLVQNCHKGRFLPEMAVASTDSKSLFENSVEFCFRGKGCLARRDKGGYPQWSPTEEQRSQTIFSSKTLRAAGHLPKAGVGPSHPRRRRTPRNFQTGSKGSLSIAEGMGCATRGNSLA